MRHSFMPPPSNIIYLPEIEDTQTVSLLFDGQVVTEFEGGECVFDREWPQDKTPRCMQWVFDGVLVYECYPQQGRVTVNNLSNRDPSWTGNP